MASQPKELAPLNLRSYNANSSCVLSEIWVKAEKSIFYNSLMARVIAEMKTCVRSQKDALSIQQQMITLVFQMQYQLNCLIEVTMTSKARLTSIRSGSLVIRCIGSIRNDCNERP